MTRRSELQNIRTSAVMAALGALGDGQMPEGAIVSPLDAPPESPPGPKEYSDLDLERLAKAAERRAARRARNLKHNRY